MTGQLGQGGKKKKKKVKKTYVVGNDRGIGDGWALFARGPELPPGLLLLDGLVLELGGARVAVELDVLLQGGILVHALEGGQRHDGLGAGGDRGIALDLVALTASHGERMLQGKAISFNGRQRAGGAGAVVVGEARSAALHCLGGQRKRHKRERFRVGSEGKARFITRALTLSRAGRGGVRAGRKFSRWLQAAATVAASGVPTYPERAGRAG